jgi:RimJ/RimL family protein N-acetyltransferase
LFDDLAIPRDQAVEIVAAAIASCRSTQWSIRLLESPDEVIGFAGVRWMDEARRQPELIYGLSEKCWGQGLATEASHTVLDYGFMRLGLLEIWGSVDAPNAASIRVMQRLGISQVDCTFTANGLVAYRIHRDDFQRVH